MIPVKGENGNASVELIFTNDIYLKMTSCTLNLNETKGELMTRAALNTLLGMGTVFVVLILISLIISAFGVIPNMQASFTSKKEEPVPVPATPVAEPVVEEDEDLSDDMELVAVIAAAIAAYEGPAFGAAAFGAAFGIAFGAAVCAGAAPELAPSSTTTSYTLPFTVIV